MAHLAFVSPPFLGHLHPTFALARELMARGHRATFLHMPDAEERARAAGLEFHTVGHDTHPPGALREITGRMAAIDGFLGLGGILRDVAGATDMLCRELPAALRTIGADALVCDGAEAAGGLVADHLGLPLVSVANALPLNREPSVPPPFVGWRYDPSSWGVERNRGGYRVSDWLLRPHMEVIERYATAWRLGRRRGLDDCLSGLAQISQTVAGFDFPRQELPAVFHHCGPIRDGRPSFPDFRMPDRDGRPLAYASLGTLQGGRKRLFRRIAEAARRADLQLVLAHGGGLDPDDTARLPGRPAAFPFVRQDEVLAGASVAVLNGGLNTVMDALGKGVPVLVVPVAFEQGAIAARLERAGAGIRVSRRLLSADRLARGMRRLLSEPSYAISAGRLAAEIAGAGGVRRAANIVEAAVSSGRPVLARRNQATADRGLAA